MDVTLSSLGPRLRDLRRARGLTLEAVAGDTGFTTGYLSQIENATAVPSITALAVISASLGSELASFFPPEPEAHVRVTRAGDPDAFRIAPNAHEEYRVLTGRAHDGEFTALLARHHPGAPLVRFRHAGEEHALVLNGELRIEVDGDVRVLGPGEWAHFSSQPKHSGEVTSDRPAEVLWVVSPGLF